MRTLGLRTHALLAVAAGNGVIAALARPWYAAAPPAETAADGGSVGYRAPWTVWPPAWSGG